MKIEEIYNKKTKLMEGIKHIEDLSIREFINNIRNIHKFIITEKIDGANLRFGLDDNGRFFTSRKTDSSKKYYSSESWGIKFWTTGFRSAHLALEKIMPEIIHEHLLEPGDIYEVEILFGKLPNTVPYRGEVNEIILLRPIKGNEEKFEKLVNFLKGKKVSVNVDNVPYTDDGKTIDYRSETHTWSFNVTPTVNLPNQEELLRDLESELKKIEDYLYQDSGISDLKNYEVLSLPLNKRPEKIRKEDWEKVKETIKIKKDEIYNKLSHNKLIIKNILLDNFVRKIGSKFGPDVLEGGWIEGVVFRDPVTNDQFKVVDKDFFTKINEFNWRIRNLLKNTSDTNKFLSLSMRIKKRMAEDIGMPELYKNVRISNFIKKNIINNRDPVEELSKNIDYYRTKKNWLETLRFYRKVLEKFLRYYEQNKNKLILTLRSENTERKIRYDQEVDRKTKETFAEMFSEIDEYIEKINQAKNSRDLAEIFLENKLEKHNLLNEGGNVFPDTKWIKKKDIYPTLEEFSRVTGIDYQYIINNLLGSSGKTSVSNDIDIGISTELYSKENIIKSLEKHLGENNVRKIGNVVSVKFPVFSENGLRTEDHVQIDLFFGDSEWLKFFYYSPGEKSKLKGIHRNMFINVILKNISHASQEKDTYGRPVEIIRYKYAPSEGGFIKIISRSVKNKKGEYLKKREETKLSSPIKDINLFAKLIFGKNADASIFDSVESLVEGVKKYLPYPEKIFRDYAETLKDNPKYYEGFEFPEEIRKYL